MNLCPSCFELLGAPDVCACGWKSDERVEREAVEHELLRETWAREGVRPKLDVGNLWGPEGNAWVVCATVDHALKQLRVPRQARERFGGWMRGGDYATLLVRANTLFELEMAGHESVDEFIAAYEGRHREGSDSEQLPDELVALLGESLTSQIDALIDE